MLLAAVLLAPVAPLTGTPVAATTGTIPTSFTVTGSGFGHGVGLPQYGAANQARDGATAEEILGYYYTGAAVTPTEDSRLIRVNLHEGVSSVRVRSRQVDVTPMAPTDDPASPVEVRVDGVVLLGDPTDTWSFASVESGRVQVTRVTPESSTVVASGASVTVHWSGTRAPGQTGETPAYLNVAGPGQSLGGTTRRYRYGWMQIVPTLQDAVPALHVVNVLGLHDEYLYGLAEVPSSWPREALRAQAVAARSYALASMRSVRSVCACHVRSTTADQVFAGWIKEVSAFGSAWRDAVDSTVTDTGGLILMAGENLVKAYFFSSSGGRTQHVEQVWTTPLAWLRSVEDPWSLREDNPYRSWTVTLSQSAVAAAFRLPDVATMSITARTAGDGIARIAGTSSSGSTVSLSGETFRLRLGLRSTWVRSIAAAGTQATPSPSASPSPSATESASPEQSEESPTPSPTSSPTGSATGSPTPSASVRTTVTAPALAVVGVPFTLSGTVTGASVGMTAQRFLRVESGWSSRGTPVAVAADGSWSMTVTADSPMALRYRVRIFTAAGQQVGQSAAFDVEVRERAPEVSLTAPARVTPTETFTLTGIARDIPTGTVVQRQILTDVGWADRGEPASPAADGTWSMIVVAPSTPQRLTFRVLLIRSGVTLVTSAEAVTEVAVPQPQVTLRAPSEVRVTRGFTLRGEVTAVTGNVTVSRQVRVGRTWADRGEPVTLTGSGAWRMRVTAPSTPQTMAFRVWVTQQGERVARSTVVRVSFTR